MTQEEMRQLASRVYIDDPVYNPDAGGTDTAATPVAEPWYKKYLWLEVAAALIVLAVALWLIFRKKK